MAETTTRTDFIIAMLDFFRVKEELRRKEFSIYDEILTTKDKIDWHRFKKYVFKNAQSRHNIPAPSYFYDLLPRFKIHEKGIVGDTYRVTTKSKGGISELEFTEVSWAKKTMKDLETDLGTRIVKCQRIRKETDEI